MNNLTNKERKTPKKYFLRNDQHEYIEEKAKEENVTSSRFLQKVVDSYKSKSK